MKQNVSFYFRFQFNSCKIKQFKSSTMFDFPTGGYLIKMTKAHFTIVKVKQENKKNP